MHFCENTDKIWMQSKIILVIDDDHSNRELIKDILEVKKYRVQFFEAADAESGIEIAQNILPDLIFMDIQLPGIDGLTATRILKSRIDTKDIPIIAISGLPPDEIKNKAIKAGCRSFIPKPVRIQYLLTIIDQILM